MATAGRTARHKRPYRRSAGRHHAGEAAEAFLARRDLDADTVRSYAQTLRRLRRDLGDAVLLGEVTAAWDCAAARTWHRHRSALRSFTTCAAGRGWVTWPS